MSNKLQIDAEAVISDVKVTSEAQDKISKKINISPNLQKMKIDDAILDSVVQKMRTYKLPEKVIQNFTENMFSQLTSAVMTQSATQKNKYNIRAGFKDPETGISYGVDFDAKRGRGRGGPLGITGASLENRVNWGTSETDLAKSKEVLKKLSTELKTRKELEKVKQKGLESDEKLLKILKEQDKTLENLKSSYLSISERVPGGKRGAQDRMFSTLQAQEAEIVAGNIRDPEATVFLREQKNELREYLRLLSQRTKLEKETAENVNRQATAGTKATAKTELARLNQELALREKNLTTEQLQTVEIKKQEIAQNKLMDALRTENKVGESGSRKGGLFSRIASAGIRVFEYGIAMKGWTAIQNAVNDAWQSVIQYDKAITNIRMVTGKSTAETRNLAMAYTDLAVSLGTSSAAVMEASDIWLRQGRSIEETNELIRGTMVLSTVAGVNAAESADMLTAIMNGYKMEASEVMHVVDALSAVDLKAAVSTQELAGALQQTAAVAQMAGVSFEELTGYVAAVAQATRLSASTIGNAYKTIFSRMQNVKLGQVFDSESGEPISDVEKALKLVDIALFEVDGSFREMDDVLNDIAQRWETLTDVERSAVAGAVAGMRQRNIFVSLMENWNDALYLSAVALNSEGSAMEKHLVYMESYEGRLASLGAAWDKFANTGLNAGFMSTAFGQLESAITFVNKAGLGLYDTLKLIVGVLLGISGSRVAGKISGIGTKMLGTAADTTIAAQAVVNAEERKRKVYYTSTRTTDQTTSAENNLTQSRKTGTSVANASASNTGTGTGGVKGLAGRALQGGGKLVGAATAAFGTYMAVEALVGALSNGLTNFFDKNLNANEALDSIQKSTMSLLEKQSATTVKENYAMYKQITSQEGELSGEMLNELSEIRTTLIKQLGISEEQLLAAESEDSLFQERIAKGTISQETREGLSELLEESQSLSYQGYSIGRDWGSTVSSGLAGAGAGAQIGGALGSFVPGIGTAIGAGIGALGGLILSSVLNENQFTARATGEQVTLAEARASTEEEIKYWESQTRTKETQRYINELQQRMETLDEAQKKQDELEETFRKEYENSFSSYSLILSDTLKDMSTGDKAILEAAGVEIAKNLTLEEMADTTTEADRKKELEYLGTLISSGEYTYAEISDMVGKEVLPSLAGNTKAILAFQKTLEIQGPTLSKAISTLRSSLEELGKSITKNINKLESTLNLQETLLSIGIDQELSGDQLRALTNPGDSGIFDTSVIGSQAVRDYVEKLIELESEKQAKIAEDSILLTEEQITEEYNKRLEILKQEYDIIKKQEELQKINQSYTSAQRQRDTLVWRDGRFSYEADPSVLQGLDDERQALENSLNQLKVQQEISEKITELILAEKQRENIIKTFKDRVETGLDTKDLEYFKELANVIQKGIDPETGLLTSGSYAEVIVEEIMSLNEDLFEKIMESGLFGNLKIDRETGKITGTYDEGGLLKGKGFFYKDTDKDEVVLSPKDAPHILNMLRNSEQLAQSVAGAERMLSPVGISSYKTQNLVERIGQGDSTNYNIDTVLVEEASDIDTLLDSVRQKTRKSGFNYVR